MFHPLARITLPLLLVLSLLPPLIAPRRPVAAQDEAQVVRTLVYRDLMPATGTEIIENFAAGGSPVLSADGSTAVYSITRNDGPDDTPMAHVYLVDIDSQESVEVDTTTQGPMLDISDDGSTALTMHQPQAGGPRLIRIARVGGAETIVEESGVEMPEAVLAGDGQSVVFTLARDSALVGIDGVAGAGIWTVNVDGSDLRQRVGVEDVRDLMGAEADDLIFFGNYPMQLDAANDGNRIVFDAVNYRTGEWFAFGLEGNGVHMLGGPYAIVTRMAISGDGSTVLRLATPYPWGTGPGEFIVSAFDGSGETVLTTNDKVGDWYEKGTQLSEDGSLALLGGSGLLYDTATGDVITLSAGCATLSGTVLPRLTMDGSGSRFLYLSYDYHFPAPLTQLELNPEEVPPGVPQISDASIDPPVINAGDGSTSTITARIDVEGTPGNCVLVLNGTVDEANLGLGVANAPMVDDGTTGDETAGDGIYTVNTLQAPYPTILSGPRTVRIKVEVQDADGYRSAMAVDVEPFAIIGGAEPAATPTTDEAAPTVEATDVPTTEAVATVEETTDDAAQGSGDWSEWEGEPGPEECTASPPNADELIETFIAAAAEPPDTSVIPAQVETEAEVPAGEPVDDETTAAVMDTVRQLAACNNAGAAAFFGLFTANGIASLFAYFGLPLQPLTAEDIQDLEESIRLALEAPPTPVAEAERAGITEIRDVRLLDDGRVLVLALADFPNGEQLGYLVLVEEDDRWLIDALGIVGEPIEIDLNL